VHPSQHESGRKVDIEKCGARPQEHLASTGPGDIKLEHQSHSKGRDRGTHEVIRDVKESSEGTFLNR
jgi:hypothetical protein